MFDKDAYWKNRKAGKRGQGTFDPVVRRHTPYEWKDNHKLHSQCDRSEIREVERWISRGDYKVVPRSDPIYQQLKEAAERSIAKREAAEQV